MARLLLDAFTVGTLAMAWASLRVLRSQARWYRNCWRDQLKWTIELEEQAHRGIIVCEAKGQIRQGAFVAVSEEGKPS
jgi:hypothetical protein